MGGPFVDDSSGLARFIVALQVSDVLSDSVRVYSAAANYPSISLYRIQMLLG
jgi:hypothetical protein